MKERRDFIEESLKLNENKILKEKPATKEEVIQMFLRNWGAVNIKVNGEQKPRKMCIPESLHEKAFRICHALPVFSHLGITRRARS